MNYTDKDYWSNYWRHFKPEIINENILFHDILKELPKGNLKCLEIGGFPGTYSIFLKKFKGFRPTLLDFYIDNSILERIMILNDLDLNDIEAIQGDIFKTKEEPEFDVVMSFGFIEHFEDTRLIIEKHLNFLKKGGSFLITLPNLRGVLGFITKKFDIESYKTHNIQSMNLKKLNYIIRELNIEKFEIKYYGQPYLYLNKHVKISEQRKKIILLLSKMFCKVLPKLGLHKNKIFSPNIVISGIK